jgi:hypothetical protein
MDPNRSSPYQTLPISPNIAYLDAGMADLDANFGEGTSSSSSNQYDSAHSLDHGLSSDLAISPLEDYDLTSQETAMLLLGPHGADLTASRLIPDLSLSEGKPTVRWRLQVMNYPEFTVCYIIQCTASPL